MDMPYFLTRFFDWCQPAAQTRPRRVTRGTVPAVTSLLGKLVLPAGFIALAIVNLEFLDRMPELCFYRLLFGVRCPGCGMTHAFCAVLHGHFLQGFSFNPLVVVAFPVFATMAVRNLRAFLNDAFQGFPSGIPH